MIKKTVVAVSLLITAILIGAACASEDLPYDAPEVGMGGVAQVLGVERYGGYETPSGRAIEVVIWRTVREDGRQCDQLSIKVQNPKSPDQWISLSHLRGPSGAVLPEGHINLPDAICLHADVAGVEREGPPALPMAP